VRFVQNHICVQPKTDSIVVHIWSKEVAWCKSDLRILEFAAARWRSCGLLSLFLFCKIWPAQMHSETVKNWHSKSWAFGCQGDLTNWQNIPQGRGGRFHVL
jgi:hypothetical protein